MAQRQKASLVLSVLLVACGAARDEDAGDGSQLSANTSAYTDLGDYESHCTEISAAETHESSGDYDCGGMGGYAAIASGAKQYEFLSVRRPNGHITNLNILDFVDAGYDGGSLGPKAEWRGTFAAPGQVNPSALIFRYLAPERDVPNRSFLLVAKLTPDAACIYAKVDGNVAGGNEKARVEADRAASVTCPSDEPPPPSGPVTSEYTSMDDHSPQCTQLPSVVDAEGIPYESHYDCGGQGGYSFHEYWGDGLTVHVKSPAGRDVPVMFGGINYSLGPRAEWRGYTTGSGTVAPFGLIFRVLRYSEEHARYHHSLVVVKLTPANPCVFTIIEASKNHENANRQAQEAAERSRSEACPTSDPEFPEMVWL
jgi:hypothetical protein